MFYPCKITVIEKRIDNQLIKSYLKSSGKMDICGKVITGQEFIVHNPYDMPEGICASAWADIRPYIITIASGGIFSFMKNEKSILASCTDLFRPVIFKIERV